MGKLIGIATRKKSRETMERHESIEVAIDTGLAGDLRGRARGRNVTVLGREGWEQACAEIGEDLPWTTRRANLLVEGVDLRMTAGATLRIGDVVLKVTGECDPCERMTEARQGLREALDLEWRGGLECTVLEPGSIAMGDPASIEPQTKLR